MGEHDQMCSQHGTPMPVGVLGCDCALIARVRADELKRIQRVNQASDRAEAIAARLVESICQQEDEWNNAMEWQEDSNRQWIETLDTARAAEKFWEERWREAAAQREQMQVERDAARAEVAALRGQREELIDALEDMVNQACTVADDREGGLHLDSMALSAYADGMRTLAKLDRIDVEHEVGRRVIGRWKEVDRG